MIKEAIVLAGGLGTRLQAAVPDVPKCLAPVAGKPFLCYVIDYWRMQGIERFIFSLGYKAHLVKQFLTEEYPTLCYETVVEEKPLGTGGAIHLALQKTNATHVLVLNGDTLFKADLKTIFVLHQQQNAACTLALKPMKQIDRYGAVEIDANGKILQFTEKHFYAEAFINGGVYLLNKSFFLQRNFPERFSFENEYLAAFYPEGKFYGCPQEGYFRDIGIPEDFQKAQTDLKLPALDLSLVDECWTLFLDRDGVINVEKQGGYVLRWEEFAFSAGALQALALLRPLFKRILVVTNQRGVGRGVMTEQDLSVLHEKMRAEVEKEGGRIDKIYYCTAEDDQHPQRKPNTGAALQATLDFPEINLSKSIMVGNTFSDMKFGRAAGMFTVFITSVENPPTPHPEIDLVFPSLQAFAEALILG